MKNKTGHNTPYHLSGPAMVTGQARYIYDEPKPADLHYAKVLVSSYAHAKIISIDIKSARQLKGVIAVVTAQDIPGKNQIGVGILDEPLLPEKEVNYIGQPVAIVVAENQTIAERAIKLISVKYRPLKPILTIDQALKQQSFLGPIRKIKRGDLKHGFTKSDYVLKGLITTNRQDHFYLETQICRAVPTEDNEMIVFSSTQSPSEIQKVVARIIGIKQKDVTVDVKRLGGGFGGKERAATIWACLTALAAYKTRKPVELRLTRLEDMSWRGKRHPIQVNYKVGFDTTGKILTYTVDLNLDGGAYADLTIAIMQRAILHVDNCYYIPNIRIIGRPCKTNLPPNTAMRGFGAPQGIFAIEYIIEQVAHKLKLDPNQIRKINFYKESQTTPYGQPVHDVHLPQLFQRLEKTARYAQLHKQVKQFNQGYKYLKRGLAVTPVKFGISFTKISHNQASALIWVYPDGTVSVSHGAIEMGQEANTKIAQIIANIFGISVKQIRIESNNTKRIGNSTPTAASVGVDLNGSAAKIAAQKILARLEPLARTIINTRYKIKPVKIIFADNTVFDRKYPNKKIMFDELVSLAHEQRIALGGHGFYKTPNIHFDPQKGKGSPFSYFVFGCALSLVEVDILSGNFNILKTYIVHENGKSINPLIDRGQIQGAYMQGFGWLTTEELIIDNKGHYITNTPSTYKIPNIKDAPQEMHIEMLQTNTRYSSVQQSKAIGEPPFIYGESVYFAVKHAIESITDYQYQANLKLPATPESILRAVEQIRTKNGTQNKSY
jgi:xanthine dehydrogenase large subunit